MNITDFDHLVVDRALTEKKGFKLRCTLTRHMRSKIVRLNRWRKEMLDVRPELASVRFCPREDHKGPYVLVEYDGTYDLEIEDEDGNLTGFTPADLAQQEYARMEEQERQQAREQRQSVSDTEERKLMKDLGLSEDDMRDSETAEETETEYMDNPQTDLTDNQRQALEDAEKQKGRPLTEEEKNVIIHATADDNLGDDLGL